MGSAQYIKNVMDVMDVLDVMDVMDVSNAYILAKNEDNATKLSGYDPWGLDSKYKISWMTNFAYPCFNFNSVINIID